MKTFFIKLCLNFIYIENLHNQANQEVLLFYLTNSTPENTYQLDIKTIVNTV